MSGRTDRAVEVVHAAARGDLGQVGIDLAALLQQGAKRGRQADADADAQRARADALDAEVWALAYVVAEIMDGAQPDDVVDDLPKDVRRRVISLRHESRANASGGWVRAAIAQDQDGRLPKPPARSSVMRSRVRTIDG